MWKVVGSKSGKRSVVSYEYMGLSASPGGGMFSAGCCPVPIASANLYISPMLAHKED